MLNLVPLVVMLCSGSNSKPSCDIDLLFVKKLNIFEVIRNTSQEVYVESFLKGSPKIVTTQACIVFTSKGTSFAWSMFW